MTHVNAHHIDMILHCPACGMKHIDGPEPGKLISGGPNAGRVRSGWNNRPHRSHLCHGCGHIWRPADVPTNGVAAIKTKGNDDSPPVHSSITNERDEAIALLKEVSGSLSWPEESQKWGYLLDEGLVDRIDILLSEAGEPEQPK